MKEPSNFEEITAYLLSLIPKEEQVWDSSVTKEYWVREKVKVSA